MLSAVPRSRFAAHPASCDHQNRQVRGHVEDLSNREIVWYQSFERRRWILDGHDSHFVLLCNEASKFYSVTCRSENKTGERFAQSSM
jgi:hypothetical protein